MFSILSSFIIGKNILVIPQWADFMTCIISTCQTPSVSSIPFSVFMFSLIHYFTFHLFSHCSVNVWTDGTSAVTYIGSSARVHHVNRRWKIIQEWEREEEGKEGGCSWWWIVEACQPSAFLTIPGTPCCDWPPRSGNEAPGDAHPLFPHQVCLSSR